MILFVDHEYILFDILFNQKNKQKTQGQHVNVNVDVDVEAVIRVSAFNYKL